MTTNTVVGVLSVQGTHARESLAGSAIRYHLCQLRRAHALRRDLAYRSLVVADAADPGDAGARPFEVAVAPGGVWRVILIS